MTCARRSPSFHRRIFVYLYYQMDFIKKYGCLQLMLNFNISSSVSLSICLSLSLCWSDRGLFSLCDVRTQFFWLHLWERTSTLSALVPISKSGDRWSRFVLEIIVSVSLLGAANKMLALWSKQPSPPPLESNLSLLKPSHEAFACSMHSGQTEKYSNNFHKNCLSTYYYLKLVNFPCIAHPPF